MSSKDKELYTSEELIWATQLAYCDFTEDEATEKATIKDIVSKRGPQIYYNYNSDSTPSGDQKVMKESTEKFIKDVANGDKCKGWKIVDIYNHEDKEGIYAIMIETDDGKSIIAFRGSESVNLEQGSKDWGQADFQIANGKMTKQEKAACRYLDEIGKTKEFDKYKNIAVTGHSLGGNLAQVATVYTATYAGMYATIWQNVDIDENDNIVFKADGLKDYLAPIVEQDPEKVNRMITGFIDNMNKTGTAGQVDMDSFREELSNLGEEYLYTYDHMVMVMENMFMRQYQQPMESIVAKILFRIV